MQDIDRQTAKRSSMYDDQVIDAAYLHSCPNCFFIGPFAKRVSFASQQYRAIDLVEALQRKGKLTSDSSVAVVGAGLAGLTATAALRGLRCKKVHLYEQTGPMHRQRGASHRVVHPTISRWPMEELRLTTRFPFLDWFAAPCDTIIAHLMQDWNENLSRTDGTDTFDFRTEVTVQGFGIRPGPGTEQVRLQTVPAFADSLYDIVLVTTGFADETTIGDFAATSYWVSDDIARRTAEDLKQWGSGKRQILVSGCGDGGLIDCLRIIHGHFRDGWLAVELAEMLGPNFDGKERIESAEHDALTAARSIACMPRAPRKKARGRSSVKASDPEFHQDAVRSEKYIAALEAAYYYVLERLPAQARKLLDDSITASGMPVQRVRLVSREPKPFVPYTAPIHKLMMAHALQETFVQYECGQVDYQRGVAHVFPRAARAYKVPNALFVVRHGAPANMIGEIGPDELASLKIRQLLMADYIDRDTERAVVPPPDYPNRTVNGERFIASRYGMAKAMVRQIAPHMRLTADRAGYRYVKAQDAQASADALPPLRLQLPDVLFGIPAEETALDDSHCLL
jgi:hypothetical protein